MSSTSRKDFQIPAIVDLGSIETLTRGVMGGTGTAEGPGSGTSRSATTLNGILESEYPNDTSKSA